MTRRPERQVGVEAAAELAHEARPDEQLVRGDFGVGRALFQRGNEILRPEFHEAADEPAADCRAQLLCRRHGEPA